LAVDIQSAKRGLVPEEMYQTRPINNQLITLSSQPHLPEEICLKTSRDSHLGLDLSIHVNKSHIHLMILSLYGNAPLKKNKKS
jgi:hypothetical protein